MLGRREGIARPKALHGPYASSPTSSCANSFGVMYPRDRAISGNKKETSDLLRKHGVKTGEELKAEGK